MSILSFLKLSLVITITKQLPQLDYWIDISSDQISNLLSMEISVLI